MHAFVCVHVHVYDVNDENVKSLYSLYTCV